MANVFFNKVKELAAMLGRPWLLWVKQKTIISTEQKATLRRKKLNNDDVCSGRPRPKTIILLSIFSKWSLILPLPQDLFLSRLEHGPAQQDQSCDRPVLMSREPSSAHCHSFHLFCFSALSLLLFQNFVSWKCLKRNSRQKQCIEMLKYH